MPFVARNGDSCGGTIIATALRTTVNGLAVARIGDQVTSHGDPPHHNAHMVEGSLTVLAEGIGVCRFGDAASCGHTISTASSDVSAG
ncbi:MAG: PAAR domain-containing protein [bacterium]